MGDDIRPGTFDPVARRLEKEAARAKDDADLKSGRVTRAELTRRNSFLASFDLSKAQVRFPERS
jgi:hypothetical protein